MKKVEATAAFGELETFGRFDRWNNPWPLALVSFIAQNPLPGSEWWKAASKQLSVVVGTVLDRKNVNYTAVMVADDLKLDNMTRVLGVVEVFLPMRGNIDVDGSSIYTTDYSMVENVR